VSGRLHRLVAARAGLWSVIFYRRPGLLVGGTYGGRGLDALLLRYRSTTGQAPPEKEKEQNCHYD